MGPKSIKNILEQKKLQLRFTDFLIKLHHIKAGFHTFCPTLVQCWQNTFNGHMNALCNFPTLKEGRGFWHIRNTYYDQDSKHVRVVQLNVLDISSVDVPPLVPIPRQSE